MIVIIFFAAVTLTFNRTRRKYGDLSREVILHALVMTFSYGLLIGVSTAGWTP